MRLAALSRAVAGGVAASLLSSSASAQPAASTHLWTLDDVVTAPDVTGLSLSADGRTAVYVVKSADLGLDREMAELRLISLESATTRTIQLSSAIEAVMRIPGSDDWSALIDRGEGVQLYRIDTNGELHALLIADETMLVGHADGALPTADNHAPRRVGVMSYEWSVDGRHLLYSVLRRSGEPQRTVFGADVEAREFQRRHAGDATIEFRIRTIAGGNDRLIVARPASDRLARYRGGGFSWNDAGLQYMTEDRRADGRYVYPSYAWDAGSGATTLLDTAPATPFAGTRIGPWGGRLVSTGFGDVRQIIETVDDGRSIAHGQVDYYLSDSRGPGGWRSSDGMRALVGIQWVRHPRYGLAAIDRSGIRTSIGNHSLTRCDFTATLAVGLCVREGMAKAPELVVVDGESLAVRRLATISPRHDVIAPLRSEARRWVNGKGYPVTGFIIWPRDYVAGRRYPTILVTHGIDADERFADSDLQWNYPVQVLAERGYLVLLVNDVSSFHNAEMRAAYEQWIGGTGRLAPRDLQDLIWLNSLAGFEAAVADVIAQGLADPARIGIAGYSRGAQMSHVAMTQSGIFRAASAGDGGYLEPSVYRVMPQSHDMVFGGSPLGPAITMYRRLSPVLRAAAVEGAVLQQMALPLSGALEFHRALRDAGRPSELALYPGESAASDETHIFHIPSNRLLAMRENLAWFDFWLRDLDPADMPFPERLDEWRAMRQQARSIPPP